MPKMPKPNVWKKVDDINIQKVYHCDYNGCKYKGIVIAISFVYEGRHELQHCTNCSNELAYSHVEVRS